MRKIKLKLVVVISMIVLLFTEAASAKTYENYTYAISRKSVIITGFDAEIKGEIEIPSKIMGYRVASIGDNAFYDCDLLASVTIPASVASIGDNAFYSCDSLNSIAIPNSVVSIGNKAFYDCKMLTSITIPDSVTSIGENAFDNCLNFNEINVSDVCLEECGYKIIHSSNGKKALIQAEDVSLWRKSGWYESDQITIYSPAGGTQTIKVEEVDSWKALGWYDSESITMYASNGTTQKVKIENIDKWRNVGWYTSDLITIYSRDGATKTINITELESWKEAGWLTSDKITMYAPDGRTEFVKFEDVEEWKLVGWYDYPVSYVYALDGRVEIVRTTDVPLWKKVGWYEAQCTMYAPNGKTSSVKFEDIDAWKRVGWYEYPVTFMLTPRDEKVVVATTEIINMKNNGWKEFKILPIESVKIRSYFLEAADHMSAANEYFYHASNNKESWVARKGKFAQGIAEVIKASASLEYADDICLKYCETDYRLEDASNTLKSIRHNLASIYGYDYNEVVYCQDVITQTFDMLSMVSDIIGSIDLW